MKYKKYLIIVGLGILIFIAAATLVKPAKQYNLDAKKLQQAPDWFMQKADGLTTNKEGQVKGTFNSPLLQHYQDSNTIKLNMPFFISYDSNNIPWHITANHGLVYQDKPQHVKLWGHVIVRQMPGKDSKQTTVYTSELFYYPDKQLATTKKPVTVHQLDSVLHAVGMDANLKTGVIKFLSKTKAEYDDDQNQLDNSFDTGHNSH